MIGKIASRMFGGSASTRTARTARTARAAASSQLYMARDPNRLGNLTFNVGQFDQFFSRWLPQTVRTVSIKVIGEKSTPLNSVIQFGLSIAFGLQRRNAKMRPVNYGIGLKVDHVNNAANIVLSTTTLALYEGVVAISQLDKEMQKEGFWKIGDVDVEALANNPVLKQALDGLLPLWLRLIPGVEGGAVEAGARAIALITKIGELLSRSSGANQFWEIGLQEDYKGGGALAGLAPIVPPKVFNALKDNVILTRREADNPQPPAYEGVDLRTLVAQVLHDPGIRPPYPHTDVGQPTLKRE